MGCEMPPERGTTCGEADSPPLAPGPWGQPGCLSPRGCTGDRGQVSGKEAPPRVFLVPALRASSSSSVQGQKLYHDQKIRKIQVLVYSLTRKPFSHVHVGIFL